MAESNKRVNSLARRYFNWRAANQSAVKNSHVRRWALLLLPIVALWLFPQAGCGSQTLRGDKAPPAKIASPVKADQSVLLPDTSRFKPDHFVLMFSGNWSGRLGPCGCAEKMLGGLDRRSAILNAVPQPSRLLLDTGQLIEKSGLQAQFKLETFLLGLKQLRYDAIGLTAQELIMKEAIGFLPDQLPPVISTGLSPVLHKKFGTVPVFEKTLELNGHHRHCLVLAMADSDTSSKVFSPIDPIEAIRKTLLAQGLEPNNPSEDRLVIVLLASQSEKLLQGLRQIRGVDLVVMSGHTDQPELTKETQSHLAVLTTGHLGKYLAAIELPVDPQAHRDSISLQAIPIEEHFTKDAKIVELIEGYLDQLRFENLVADEDKLPRFPLEEDNFFVGTETCGNCHEGAYAKWLDVRHSHALQTLIEQDRQADPECVRCHSVGMFYESGFRSMESTPDLGGVGCEMCHGPGGNHITNTEQEFKVTFTACAQCHDSENDPHFAEHYAEKFQKIKHWQDKPRSAWH